MAGRIRWKRWRLGAFALAAVLLTGCSVAYTTTPAITVQNFFLYLNRGAMESAWQDLDLPLQTPGADQAMPQAADGSVGTSLHWAGQSAFDRAVRRQLEAFLHGARVAQSVQGVTATVTVRAHGPSRSVLYVDLQRVDNEWVFEQMVLVGPVP